MTYFQEPFSVDMSRILRSTGDDGIATVHDIQQLLLFSLLGPENNRSLPQWAKLNHKCVKKVVVVLLKYVTPTLFDKNEDCFMKIGCMFDCVSSWLMFAFGTEPLIIMYNAACFISTFFYSILFNMILFNLYPVGISIQKLWWSCVYPITSPVPAHGCSAKTEGWKFRNWTKK